MAALDSHLTPVLSVVVFLLPWREPMLALLRVLSMSGLLSPGRPIGVMAFAWFSLVTTLCVAQEPRPGDDDRPRIELRAAEGGARYFAVVGIKGEVLRKLEERQRDGTLANVLTVYAGSETESVRPAMLGETRLENDALVFEPRFPLEPGVTYRAVLRLAVGADDGSSTAVSQVFALEKPHTTPAAVTHVYPSADVLPENQLKFYLHFSRPMSRGDAYRHVKLVRSDGQVVEYPFLELGEELWDPTGTRFTLFFDPGRIKRGLKPREEVGPALEEGKAYTLVISADWPDAQGQPLAEEFRKKFRVVAPDDEQPQLSGWRVTAPPAETLQPLEVRFPEPLDHAMLGRVLHVVDSSGETVPGEIEISENETRWRLTPKEPWLAGDYRLVVATALEDLAGNSIRRPFEVDVTRPVEFEKKVDTASLPVSVRPAPRRR